MNITDQFPSAYLKASDILGKNVIVEIEACDAQEFDGEGSKAVLAFKGKDSRLVLNKTRANTLCGIFQSEETDDWIGKKIVLSTCKVPFNGQLTDSITVAAAPEQPPKQEQDDVPF